MYKRGTSAYKAFTSLVRSARAHALGNTSEAHAHYQEARGHADTHRKSIASIQGATQKFDSDIAPVMKDVETRIGAAPKASTSGLVAKVKGLFKANPTMTRRNYNATGKVEDAVVNRSPGYTEKHNFVSHMNLHPEDQKSANKSFQNKLMQEHMYPVDKQTGRLVAGAQRMRISAPQADQHYTKNVPHYEAGAGVTVHKPGSALHGQAGRVISSNPEKSAFK